MNRQLEKSFKQYLVIGGINNCCYTIRGVFSTREKAQEYVDQRVKEVKVEFYPGEHEPAEGHHIFETILDVPNLVKNVTDV